MRIVRLLAGLLAAIAFAVQPALAQSGLRDAVEVLRDIDLAVERGADLSVGRLGHKNLKGPQTRSLQRDSLKPDLPPCAKKNCSTL